MLAVVRNGNMGIRYISIPLSPDDRVIIYHLFDRRIGSRRYQVTGSGFYHHDKPKYDVADHVFFMYRSSLWAVPVDQKQTIMSFLYAEIGKLSHDKNTFYGMHIICICRMSM